MYDSNTKPRNSIPSCIICRYEFDEFYRIPRVIPTCGHTFCQKCINTHLQVKANRKIFSCVQCKAEIIIRRNVSDDVPKNIGILDIVKNLRKKEFQENSPSNHKNFCNFGHKSQKNVFCSQHINKQMDMICETCNYQKVCSVCILTGKSKHLQHKFVQFIPASSTDLQQVSQIYAIIQSSVSLTILPTSGFNILNKAQQSLISSLIESVKNHFKQNYYRTIQKKEQQLIGLCKEIKFQGGLTDKIQKIVKQYDFLKYQYQDLFNKKQKHQNTSLSIIQDFIKNCKDLHTQIEKFSEQAQNQAKKLFNQLSVKISQSTIFKINQLPFSLKSLFTEKNHFSSPKKSEKVENLNKSRSKADNGLNTGNSFKAKSQKGQQYTVTVRQVQPYQQKKPSSILLLHQKPPKPIKTQSQLPQQPVCQQVNKLTKKKPSSSTQRFLSTQNFGTKKMNSSVQKAANLNCSVLSQLNKEVKIKDVRAGKEVPLNMKAKYTAIVSEIVRQAGSQTLELINMEINDTLIVYICDYLRTKKLKFVMIKLVKNIITDQGLSILFGLLVNDNSTQVLNLTSNALTSKSLDLVAQLGQTNKFLKTIYLSNNKISKISLKAKKDDLQSVGVQVII